MMKTNAMYFWRDSTRFIPIFGLLWKKILTLPFLDVLVEKCSSKFITSIYRKPTFAGQYIHWNSFSPQKHKTYLILTLTHRALTICSPQHVQLESDKIKSMFLDNGYPEHIINSYMTKKTHNFTPHQNSVQ